MLSFYLFCHLAATTITDKDDTGPIVVEKTNNCTVQWFKQAISCKPTCAT